MKSQPLELFLDSTQSNLHFKPSFAAIHEVLRDIWLFEHKFQARNFWSALNFIFSDDIINLLNFIFTGLHGYQFTQGLSTNKQRHRLLLLKDGDTCCANSSLSNA